MSGVVVTGMGVVSPFGRGLDAQREALRTGRSGVVAKPEWAESGLRSLVAGDCPVEPYRKEFSKKDLRFLSPAGVLGGVALKDAIADAGLTEEEVQDARTSLFGGTGAGASILDAYELGVSIHEKGAKKTLPYFVPLAMGSSITANLSKIFKIHGASFTITSACTTSAHAILVGLDWIRTGRADVVFAGGAEDVNAISAGAFDAMRALSSGFNDRPEAASRPLDKRRDGFVFAGGGAFVVLEREERARARGARIYARLAGGAATSDGYDMVVPSGEGAVRAMADALRDADFAPADVDYINLHATSTPVGDVKEIEAVVEVFGKEVCPAFSSTKSMTGHGLGAAGAMEAIFSILAVSDGFLPPNVNLDEPEDLVADLPVVREPREAKVRAALTNSFGFGGTNCSLVFAAA